jgi:hypothetical protein
LLPEVAALTIDEDRIVRVRQGVDFPAPADWPAVPALVRLLDTSGQLVALAVPGGQAGVLHPSVVLG